MTRARLARFSLLAVVLVASGLTPGPAAAQSTGDPDVLLDTALVDALASVDMGAEWLEGSVLSPELALVRVEGEQAQAAQDLFVSQAAELVEVDALLDLLVSREQAFMRRVTRTEGMIVRRLELLDKRRAELAIVVESLEQAAVERYVMGRAPAPLSTDLDDVYDLVTDVRLVEAAVEDLIGLKAVLDGLMVELDLEIDRLDDDLSDAVEALELLREQLSAQGSRLFELQRSLPETMAAAREARPLAVLPGLGLSLVTVDAYVSAERQVAATHPDCRIRWQALAGVSRVESNHGRFRGGHVEVNGRVTVVILGPVLNGKVEDIAEVVDTDGGALDGNAKFERAVGPMQFLPQTWQSFGADGNGDGVVDVHNLYDATLAAARYLCYRRSSLDDEAQLRRALLTYNQSGVYADTVRSWAHDYDEYQVPPVPPELIDGEPPADVATVASG